MDIIRRIFRGKKPDRLVTAVIVLAVAVVAIGIVGAVSAGGRVIGGLPGIEEKET